MIPFCRVAPSLPPHQIFWKKCEIHVRELLLWVVTPPTYISFTCGKPSCKSGVYFGRFRESVPVGASPLTAAVGFILRQESKSVREAKSETKIQMVIERNNESHMMPEVSRLAGSRVTIPATRLNTNFHIVQRSSVRSRTLSHR